MESKLLLGILVIILLISLVLNVVFLIMPHYAYNLAGIAEGKPNIRSSSFVNYGPPERPEGILSLKNIGNIPLNSNKFKLYLNKELQDDDGCELKEKIDPGYSCKLNFYKTCHTEDIIEVTYAGEKVYMNTC